MSLERDWSEREVDVDRKIIVPGDDKRPKRSWISEGRCPECEHTKGHALGCPNA